MNSWTPPPVQEHSCCFQFPTVSTCAVTGTLEKTSWRIWAPSLVGSTLRISTARKVMHLRDFDGSCTLFSHRGLSIHDFLSEIFWGLLLPHIVTWACAQLTDNLPVANTVSMMFLFVCVLMWVVEYLSHRLAIGIASCWNCLCLFCFLLEHWFLRGFWTTGIFNLSVTWGFVEWFPSLWFAFPAALFVVLCVCCICTGVCVCVVCVCVCVWWLHWKT